MSPLGHFQFKATKHINNSALDIWRYVKIIPIVIEGNPKAKFLFLSSLTKMTCSWRKILSIFPYIYMLDQTDTENE